MDQLVPSLLFLVIFVGIFYLMLIRPQRKRQEQHRQLVRSLKRGDEVVSAGGICGVIKKVDKESVLLETEGGTTLKILKDSIVERKG